MPAPHPRESQQQAAPALARWALASLVLLGTTSKAQEAQAAAPAVTAESAAQAEGAQAEGAQAEGAHAEGAQARPFGARETLAYRVSIGKVGGGIGWMRVEPASSLRGEPVSLLRFDFAAKVGPFDVQHHARSWLSRERLASLRYEVDEQVPMRRVKQRFELFPDERRWVGLTGSGASGPSGVLLDELSSLYALRTLALAPGAEHRLDWHFDPRRNPVVVRALRREQLKVPAGEFSTVVVEMEVRDPGRYGGRGLLRLYVTDDARRLPVRIESQVPVAGQLVLELWASREES
jgi:hypothetical protein